MRKFLIGLAAIAVLTSSLNAMGGDRGGKGQDRKKHSIIKCVKQLDSLTAEQNRHIKVLEEKASKKRKSRGGKMMLKGSVANFLTEKGFDRTAFVKTHKEMMAKKVERKASMIETVIGILTPAQIKQLKSMIQVKMTKKMFKHLSPEAVLELRPHIEKKALVK